MATTRRLAILIAAHFAGLIALPSSAQNLTPAAHLPIDDTADDLRAGQYIWRDSGYAETPVSVVVNVAQQLAYVYRGDRLIGAASVSTGTRGHSTPLGNFTILQKREFHRSNLYSNAPMPLMQRLTWDGIALHAGYNPGYPASHGCIRLPRAFASLLYGVTALGAPVTIVGGNRAVRPAPAPDLRDVPLIPLIPTIIADARGLRTADFTLVTWREEADVRIGGDERIVPEAGLGGPRNG